MSRTTRRSSCASRSPNTTSCSSTARKDANRAHRNLIKTIEKQKASREERLKDLLAEDKKDDGLVFDELGVDHVFIDEAHYFKNLETPTKMERVAGIQTGGSERAFDLYMKARYLRRAAPRPRRHLRHRHADHQHDGRDVHDAAVPRPRGAQRAAASSISTPGRPPSAKSSTRWKSPPTARRLRPRSRFARFVNLPELQQMFRAFADVQTAEMLDLPRPALEGGKPIVVACPMSEEQATHPAGAGRPLRAAPLAEGRSPRGQRPGHHHRRPQARPRRPAALGRRRRTSRTRRSTPWSRTSPPSGSGPRPTRGTQMIFCDMGVNPTPWGYSVYDEIIDKLVGRGIPREQIAAIGDADSDAKKQALFEKVRQRHGPRADRQHAEDGHRHQRPETAGGPASPRRPVEAGRGRAARGPHPPAGQRERGSGDLPLRHRRIVRRLYVAGTGDQGPVHRPGDDRRIGRPPGRGHRRPGTVLRRGEGDRLGQPGRADAGRGRRRAAAAGHAAGRTTPTSSTSPAAPSASCPPPSTGWKRRVAGLAADMATAAAHADDPITIGGRPCDAEGRRRPARPPPQIAARQGPRDPPLPARHAIAAWPSASCCTRSAPPRPTSKARSPATPSLPRCARPACRPERPRPPGRQLRRASPPPPPRTWIAQAQLRDYEARLGQPFAHEAYLAELTDRPRLPQVPPSPTRRRSREPTRSRPPPSWPSGSSR